MLFSELHCKCLTLGRSSRPVTASYLQRPWGCNHTGSDLFSSNRVCLGRATPHSSFSCSLLFPAPRWDKITIFIFSISGRRELDRTCLSPGGFRPVAEVIPMIMGTRHHLAGFWTMLSYRSSAHTSTLLIINILIMIKQLIKN